MSKTKTLARPTQEEIAYMGCDGDTCGECLLYVWAQMLDEWQPLEGRCQINPVLECRADSVKCAYFVANSNHKG